MISLNASIAQQVFGLNVVFVGASQSPLILSETCSQEIPAYDQDWKLCMSVVDRLHERGFAFGLFRENGHYLGGFGRNGRGMKYASDVDPILAILKGALMAVGEK